jgi:hypothetical protein
MDAEILYYRLGRLLGDAPDLSSGTPLSQAQHQWLGRVGAIVDAVGDSSTRAGFRVASENIDFGSRSKHVHTMFVILSRKGSMKIKPTSEATVQADAFRVNRIIIVQSLSAGPLHWSR